MSVNHIISGIYNLRIGEVILIGEITTLLDYGQQFMGSLYTVNSRSHTGASSYCYLYKVLECS